jgi:MoxR-like ATPase
MAPERSVEDHAERLARLREELARRIVGQEEVVTQVLAAILAEGHCLIIGLPGLAKTLLVSSLSELLSLEFKRIQFTPDLMPSDITGATILTQENPGNRDFKFLAGPIFANVILADEINRTPPKTQAALIEAMEERQVSAGGQRLRLDRPFFVLATQNPIEQQGTYPLPISQLDRFLFNILIDYPSSDEEFRILVRTTSTYDAGLTRVFTREEVVELIAAARQIEVDPALIDYASRIVRATRPLSSGAPAFTRDHVAWGGGPRATQSLIAAGRSFALLAGRSRVEHADIHRAALPTLRHRILLRYHAQAEGIHTEQVIANALAIQPEGLYRPEPRPVPEATAPRGLLARLRAALTR